jgi:MoaA/NifB/PqqE/SkfB family radical SAM enzyme
MISIHTLCIELTARCALRCTHCSANASPERNEMLDAETLVQRLDEVGTLEEVYLSGGEPFEHTDIATIVGASRRVARAVVVYSSGVWMGAHGDEALPSNLIRSTADGISRVDLSLYAANADAHDAVTQTPGSFVRTLETARRLGQEGVAFGVHHVPVASNSSVVKVADLAADLGAVRFHVLAVAAQGRARRLDLEEPSARLLHDLRTLQAAAWPFELVVSTGLRRALGQVDLTPRDLLRTAFLDVRGFLYPGEGQRLISLRGRSSMVQRSLREMYSEISTHI